MSTVVVDGRALAERITRQTRADVAELRVGGVAVELHAIMVGEPAAGRIYAQSQERHCTGVGIGYHLHALPAEAAEADIRELIGRLNHDPAATGIMLHLPLPDGIRPTSMQFCIDPYKDVEGVTPANIGLLFYEDPIVAPCTALAVLEILREARCDVRGKHVCVIGQGPVAGRPIALALLTHSATVTGCSVDTPDIGVHASSADVVIAAAGVPQLVRASHIKRGAVVIDVGINRVRGERDDQGKPRIVGDVDFESVRERAGVITPVPGGVGPVTVAMLLRSAVEAARKQLERRCEC